MEVALRKLSLSVIPLGTLSFLRTMRLSPLQPPPPSSPPHTGCSHPTTHCCVRQQRARERTVKVVSLLSFPPSLRLPSVGLRCCHFTMEFAVEGKEEALTEGEGGRRESNGFTSRYSPRVMLSPPPPPLRPHHLPNLVSQTSL